MTLDDLSAKMDKRFDVLDAKVDSITTTVAVHSSTLQVHDRENKKMDERVSKLEKLVWISLGSGGAAGAGLVKLFCT